MTGAPGNGAPEPERRPGRPRSTEVEQTIREAALEEFMASGLDGLRIEAVAARAGVGKATIYRRWANRDALVVDALAALPPEPMPLMKGDSARDDLVASLQEAGRRERESIHSRLLPRVIAAARTHPELMEDYRRRVTERRREHLRTIMRRGVATGELRQDLDLELALKALVFPILYAAMNKADDQALPEEFAGQIVDLLIQGLGPVTAVDGRPGSAPSAG